MVHFKFLRKYFDEKQFLKIVSGNYYGTVFYGCTVWFDNIKSHQKTKLTSLHFRLPRVACKDFTNLLSKDELMTRCQRATPIQWVKFLTASKVIKIIRDEQPKSLHDRLHQTKYEEPRKPGIGLFYDKSKRKPGKQALNNRLDLFKDLKIPWTNTKLSNDEIRMEMKKCFFNFGLFAQPN